jgi:hypothetical protein
MNHFPDSNNVSPKPLDMDLKIFLQKIFNSSLVKN